ncbi:fructose-bisphosphate aldolase [Thermoanaerobacteraceae bacterium SP2]|nr:fructose-bisphosphate aldolase [Thermoanaerobacteraceae bacterium SP2]
MTDLSGKKIRLKRLLGEGGKTIALPMDHGAYTNQIKGLENPFEVIKLAMESNVVDAVLLEKGILQRSADLLKKDTGIIMRLSETTDMGPEPNVEVAIATVEEAISRGSDAVILTAYLGSPKELEMLENYARVAEECRKLGMIFIGEPMVGNQKADPYDPEYNAFCARVGVELGADILKVSYTGSEKSFRKVVEMSLGAPVWIAGGPAKSSNLEILQMVEGAMAAGASGIIMGRNIFSNEKPDIMLKALDLIVKKGKTASEAIKLFS